MRPSESTSWLLSGRAGWRTDAQRTCRIAAGCTGLRLAADAQGPLGLAAADGSLGGLTLPRHMALGGDGALYLLDPARPAVLRFDPLARRFEPLAQLGGAGAGPHQLHQPAGIAVAGRTLYLADTGNRRVQAYDLDSLALRHSWLGAWLTVTVPERLVAALRDAAEPFTAYLRRLLPLGLRQRLDAQGADAPAPGELAADLAAELRRLAAAHTLDAGLYLGVPADAPAILSSADQTWRNLMLLAELLPPCLAAQAWRPTDLAAHGGAAYILDAVRGRVYRHHPGSDALALVVDQPKYSDHWTRLALDRDGRIYLYNARQRCLDIYDADNRWLGLVCDELAEQPHPPGALTLGEARERFEPAPLRVSYAYPPGQRAGRFAVPAQLTQPCRSRQPQPPPAPEAQLLLPPTPVAPDAAPWLSAGDLTGVDQLAQRLRAGCDPISHEIAAQLGEATRRLLAEHTAGTPPPALLRQALADELNRRLGDPALFALGRAVAEQATESPEQLSPQDAALSAAGRAVRFPPQIAAAPAWWRPPASELPQLNRLLLQAIYADELRPPAVPSQPGLVFDERGEPATVAAGEVWPRLYTTAGAWVSAPLDSRRHRCQWHRIELELAALPAGASVRVSTCVTGDRHADTIALTGWQLAYSTVGPNQPRADAEQPSTHELLVQSQPGQYLRLKIELAGDGGATPVVGALRVSYPRESYLGYLPAIYSMDDQGRWFLERFLAAFQTEWDAIERQLDRSAAYFDPRATPDAFVNYLGRWLSLSLDQIEPIELRRSLLAAAARALDEPGTPASMRRTLAIYLQHFTGLSEPQLRGYPQIIEGFRERQRLQLSFKDRPQLGDAHPLWGPGQNRRLQLDVFARLGEAQLISTGDPRRDLFNTYAHRFRVFVPSAWVATAEREQQLQRAIASMQPAHTSGRLELVAARMQIGRQSTVGLDTIIGPIPHPRLSTRAPTTAPSGLPPLSRLGFDTVLAARRSRYAALRLAPGLQLGLDTALI